jgi:uncharacterized membrane protein YkvA (DUF1232 family)
MADKKDKDEDKIMQSSLTTQEIVDKTPETITKQKSPGFWREVWQQTRLVFRLMGDPEVPFYLKFVPFLGLLYVLMPVDLIPDFLLMVGQLDDITALIVGAKIFIELAPPHVVARHMQEIRIKDGYEMVVEGEVVDQLNDAIIIDPDSGKPIVQKEPEDLE